MEEVRMGKPEFAGEGEARVINGKSVYQRIADAMQFIPREERTKFLENAADWNKRGCVPFVYIGDTVIG